MRLRALLCAAVAPLLIASPAHAQDGRSRDLIAKYWTGPERARALEVARCESGYDENDHNDVDGGHDGVFQLARKYHAWRADRHHYDWSDMHDAGKNTIVALSLYRDEGWTPWESSRSCWG